MDFQEPQVNRCSFGLKLMRFEFLRGFLPSTQFRQFFSLRMFINILIKSPMP